MNSLDKLALNVKIETELSLNLVQNQNTKNV